VFLHALTTVDKQRRFASYFLDDFLLLRSALKIVDAARGNVTAVFFGRESERPWSRGSAA
jgi:hypothetical protein